MKRGLIVTGGKLNLAFARTFLEKESFDKIVAVDAGLESVKALGLMPDYVVGDFDTAKTELLEEYRKIPYIVWDVHKPEKNETDTELALSRISAIGCDTVVLLGATGGRLDHMLSNIQALSLCMKKGICAYLVDEQNRICMLDEGRSFKKEQQWGKYISFLPFTEEVKGITLTGFKYPLTDRDITLGEEYGLCISNEIVAESAEISFREGILICIESRD